MKDVIPAVLVDTAPTSEPLTLKEAKLELGIASGQTAHDERVTSLIKQAREQFEYDTGFVAINTTFTHTIRCFETDIELTHRNPSSITSIKYYDGSDVQQTVSTDVYSIDVARRLVRLKHNQDWPTPNDRWDAVEIKYVAGAGTVSTDVPERWREAMLLQLHLFDGEDDTENWRASYDHKIAGLLRPSYL